MESAVIGFSPLVSTLFCEMYILLRVEKDRRGNDVYTSLPSGGMGKTFHEVADELSTIKKSCNDDFIIIKRMEVVILSTKPLQLQP